VRKVLVGTVLLGLGLSVGTVGTRAAFTSTTSNSGNGFQAGSVAISDNDAGSAMLSLSSAQPADSDTSCIQVTYSGTLDSGVHLYATVSGALAPYLTLTVTRGTDSSPGFDACGSFSPDGTNYIGAGPGVVYSGLLSAFPSTYAAGIVDAPGSPETWTTSEAHSYRFLVSLNNDNAAQGLSAAADFTWEAQNL
jgi:predicted ribosomally synthesized peptide with SipW-like signal peptide